MSRVQRFRPINWSLHVYCTCTCACVCSLWAVCKDSDPSPHVHMCLHLSSSDGCYAMRAIPCPPLRAQTLSCGYEPCINPCPRCRFLYHIESHNGVIGYMQNHKLFWILLNDLIEMIWFACTFNLQSVMTQTDLIVHKFNTSDQSYKQIQPQYAWAMGVKFCVGDF